MSRRIKKIDDLVRDAIADILIKHLSFKKGVFVSVIRVDTTKDLRYAQVFVSVFPVEEQDYAIKTISKELYRIQGLLNKKLCSKILPRLKFVLDTTQQDMTDIEKVFRQIHEEHDKDR
ncbi:MAG: ribosome-binding factor A [Patescibacteria group bacterium]|nr:ribosome-binding factor A [Patescibacteria group bacterium]